MMGDRSEKGCVPRKLGKSKFDRRTIKLCTFTNDFLFAETDATQCRYLRFLVAVGLRWPGTEALAVLLFPVFGHGEVALGSGLRCNEAWLSSLRASHLPGGSFRG